MADPLGDYEVDDLLKVVLLLAAVWLVFEITGRVLSAVLTVLGSLRPVIALVVVVLVLLWFFDRL